MLFKSSYFFRSINKKNKCALLKWTFRLKVLLLLLLTRAQKNIAANKMRHKKSTVPRQTSHSKQTSNVGWYVHAWGMGQNLDHYWTTCKPLLHCYTSLLEDSSPFLSPSIWARVNIWSAHQVNRMQSHTTPAKVKWPYLMNSLCWQTIM